MISGLYTQTLSGIPCEARFDVDGPHPQNKVSLNFGGGCPAHWIAHLSQAGQNVWRGDIWYRKDNANTLMVDANGNLGGAGDLPNSIEVQYGGFYEAGGFYYIYVILRNTGSGNQWYYWYQKAGDHFRTVEVEFDTESGIAPLMSMNPHSIDAHRPASLANEEITVASTFARAGVQIVSSAGASSVASNLSGGDVRWTDAELHDAMQGAWSRQEGAAWAMWMFQGNRHIDDMTGIMFDSIGAFQRSGTALFHGYTGYTGADAGLVTRHKFVTLVHEMGHCFNLYHSWLKTSGTSNWHNSVANEPEARSYMNYPDRVAAGYYGFFDTFEYRFSDQELLFLRHAPTDLVRMGGTWGSDHAGSTLGSGLGSGLATGDVETPRNFSLRVHCNKERPVYEYLEPVHIELELTNTSGQALDVAETLLEDTAHMYIGVSRNGGLAREHRPYSVPCTKQEPALCLQPGESLRGSVFLSAALSGWLVADPGIYEVTVAVPTPGEDDNVAASSTFRFTVLEPAPLDRKARREREILAQDFFREDVARTLVFGGTRRLNAANETLQELVDRFPTAKAAVHAELTLALPRMREFKSFQRNDDGSKSIVTEAVDPAAIDTAKKLLVDKADKSVSTLGHVSFAKLSVNVANAMRARGDDKAADATLGSLKATMDKRGAKVSERITRKATPDQAGQ